MRMVLGAALAALLVTPVTAQSTYPTRAAKVNAPGSVPLVCNASGLLCGPASDATPLPVGSVRESFRLVAANVPTAPAIAYGGDYILSQSCTSYGTLTLQALGPDGVTWTTLLTKSASDSGSGTGLALGSYASVRITVSGTAGCNAVLARVPA